MTKRRAQKVAPVLNIDSSGDPDLDALIESDPRNHAPAPGRIAKQSLVDRFKPAAHAKASASRSAGHLGTIELTVSGLGVIAYSPQVVRQFKRGRDYMASYIENLRSGKVIAFNTEEGDFLVNVFFGPRRRPAGAISSVRLPLVVRGGEVCFADAYTLMRWSPAPGEQRIRVSDGAYTMTVFAHPKARGFRVLSVHLSEASPESVELRNEMPVLL